MALIYVFTFVTLETKHVPKNVPAERIETINEVCPDVIIGAPVESVSVAIS